MKAILMDTSGYAAFKKGDEQAVEIVRLAEMIGISTVVLGELIAGFVSGSREAKNRQELSEFMASPRVNIYHVTEDTAEFFARIYKRLKKKGSPIPTNDLWIAATAMEHGLALFSLDRHFSAVENLVVCRQFSDLLP